MEMQSTGLLGGQVPDQWLLDSSLHICQVRSRFMSSRTLLQMLCCHLCPSSWERPSHPDAPDLNEVLSLPGPTPNAHLPRSLRPLPSHNGTWAWTDLL